MIRTAIKSKLFALSSVGGDIAVAVVVEFMSDRIIVANATNLHRTFLFYVRCK